MRQVVDIVRQHLIEYRPVIVLSAMSSHQKSQGTTSRLLQAAELVLSPPQIPSSPGIGTTDRSVPIKPYVEVVDTLKRDHLQAAIDAIADFDQRAILLAQVRDEFQRLSNFLEAAEVLDEMTPRTKDVIIGTGERLSCLLMTRMLISEGLSASYVSMDRCVDQHFPGGARFDLDQRFYDFVRARAAHLVIKSAYPEESQSNEYHVPVVTGFLGNIPNGLLQVVGRGYTDFTAALVAAGLKTFSYRLPSHPSLSRTMPPVLSLGSTSRLPFSDGPQPVAEVQIWKEVDGIFTADPRQVPKARLLSEIYPDEAAELTYYGSEVIHPFTMEQVMRARVPIRIKNTFKPGAPGTIIMPETGGGPTSSHESSDSANGLKSMKATAVTLKTDIICLNVHSNRKSHSHGFLAKVFAILDRHGVVVDLISTSEVHVSTAISCKLNSLTLGPGSPRASASFESSAAFCSMGSPKLDAIIQDLQPCGDVSIIPDMAILSLVGKQMKNMVGISGRMFSTLAKNGVNIEMISQGASEINISCVILESDSKRALQSVHDVCVLGE